MLTLSLERGLHLAALLHLARMSQLLRQLLAEPLERPGGEDPRRQDPGG